MSDLLYFTACLTFFAAMLGFVLLYDRSVTSRIYEAPDAPGEANGRDVHVPRPA
jgi:hypothetical protein